MTLDALERMAKEGGEGYWIDDNPAQHILALIARLRATEALVERAFAEGFAAGVDAREWRDFDSAMDREAGKWRRSDAKAALDRLREGEV